MAAGKRQEDELAALRSQLSNALQTAASARGLHANAVKTQERTCDGAFVL